MSGDATNGKAADPADDKDPGCCDNCLTKTASCVVSTLTAASAAYDRFVWQKKWVLLTWWTIMCVYYFITAIMGGNDLPRPSGYLSSADFEHFDTTSQMQAGCCYETRTASLRPLVWCVSNNFLAEFYFTRQLLTVFDSAFPWIALVTFFYHITGLLYIESSVLASDATARQKLKDVLFTISAAVFMPIYFVILSCVAWGIVGPINFFNACAVPGSVMASNAAAVDDRLSRFYFGLALSAPDPLLAGLRLFGFAVFYAYVMIRAMCVQCKCCKPKYAASRAADAGEPACCSCIGEVYNPAVRGIGADILGPLLRIIGINNAPTKTASDSAPAPVPMATVVAPDASSAAPANVPPV